MVSEFIDAYSDDQIYLDMLEKLVELIPVESVVPPNIKYSVFFRIWAVIMVGGIECMINECARDELALNDICSYFDPGSNNQRIERLRSAFNSMGIEAKIEHFEDFLAVKYIRNAYIHGEWKIEQRNYVVQRGFPATLMTFDASHCVRMKESYFHIMRCLGTANVLNTLLARPTS